jgi:hypothetical protein
MPLEIKITGDQAEALNVLDQLHKSLHRPDIETMPIDDLLAVTQRRFFDAGFAVTVDNIATALPEVEIPPAEAEAAVDKIEEKLAETKAPRKKTTTAKKPAEAAPVKEPVSEVDKDFVVAELTRRFADPKQKLKAKAFIDKVAKRNAGIRISLLDPELFPAIRAEMDAEFGASPSNGAGGAHA